MVVKTEKICEQCECPVRKELDADSCWCGVAVSIPDDKD